MELTSGLTMLSGFFGTAVPFIFVLAVVIFIHEYGHYIVGRWCGIHAEAFSMGFGPILASWIDKRGTKWQISAIPLGGYVRFLGDADGTSRADSKTLNSMSAQNRSRSFHGASLVRRALTVLAGPGANFVLSVILFAALVLIKGIATENPIVGEQRNLPGMVSELKSGDLILEIDQTEIQSWSDIYEFAGNNPAREPHAYKVRRDDREIVVDGPFPLPPMVGAVQPLSPASKAGLMPGDFVLSFGGEELRSFAQMRDLIMANGSEPTPITVLRKGQELVLQISPQEQDAETQDGGFTRRIMIGVIGQLAFDPAIQNVSIWQSAQIGVRQTYSVISRSLNFIFHIFTGDVSASNLQGPLGIAQVAGEVADNGLLDLLWLVAVISTSIGMLNLFPIPVLDGGHLLIFGYEALRGKPPPESVLNVLMAFGMSFVLLLMVFATYNDILRL